MVGDTAAERDGWDGEEGSVIDYNQGWTMTLKTIRSQGQEGLYKEDKWWLSTKLLKAIEGLTAAV